MTSISKFKNIKNWSLIPTEDLNLLKNKLEHTLDVLDVIKSTARDNEIELIHYKNSVEILTNQFKAFLGNIK